MKTRFLSTVSDIAAVLGQLAPPDLAESWDNVGLLLGDGEARVRRLMLTIDMTAPVVAEARRGRCEMIVAYHPPIFKPISRLTLQSSPAIWQAAAAGLAVYSPHTALDSAPGGTNDVLAEACGIVDSRPLTPAVRTGMHKLVVFVPPQDLERVSDAAFAAGAGKLGNYSHCSFRAEGVGQFLPAAGARPAIGQVGRLEELTELRLEVLVPPGRLADIVSAVRGAHSYEMPAIDIYPLVESPDSAGQGRIGRFEKPLTLPALVRRLKQAFGLKNVQVVGRAYLPDMLREKKGSGKYARPTVSPLLTTAACGAGACGSMLRPARSAGADVFITGEIRHHDALWAAENGLTVICLGHSHSERKTLASLSARLSAALPGLGLSLSKTDRDPLEIL